MAPADCDALLPHELSVSEAARRLREGLLSAEEYASALLERCDEQAQLNAFAAVDAQAVMTAALAADRRRSEGGALGRLHGIPLALKDNIPSERMPTSGGTAALAQLPSRHNAPAIERLFAEGALLLGKNTMHELAMGWTSDNPHFGRVGNPHAPQRLAGGSSGGSAAAVAAMMVPAAIGSDTNGSIRIPAALCGVAGFRPSVGRYPTHGVIPLSPTLDTLGPIARSADDLVLLDAVLAGQPVAAQRPLRGVRLGISPTYFLSRLEPEVEAVFQAARMRLTDAGATFVEADVPRLGELVEGLAPALIQYESALALPAWLAMHGGVSIDELIERAGDDLAGSLRAGQRSLYTDEARAAYHCALRRRVYVSGAMHRYFAEHRVAALVYPVARVAAPLAERSGPRVSPAPDVRLADGRLMSAREAFGQNVSPASIAALPSLVLPAGMTPAGLPVGLAFDAPHSSDDALLGLATALEEALVAAPLHPLPVAQNKS